jgi:DNA 3'-phosphatase
MNKALFSDLDGTLIRTKSGKKFPENKDDWELDYTVLNAMYNYMFKNLSGTLCIVTNQGGVEAGYSTVEDMNFKLHSIKEAIEKYFIDKYSYNVKVDYGACFTNDPTDFLRKPNPGLGYHLALRNNLSLSKCIMVGDASGLETSFSDTDFGFAQNCVMNYFDVEQFVALYSLDSVYKNNPLL